MRFPEFKNLPIIWISLIVILVILGFSSSTGSNLVAVSFYAVFVHAFLVLLVLGTLPLKINYIFIWAFLARLLFMFWDFYAQNIFILPNSGADTEVFYHNAVKISTNLSNLNIPVRGGIYSKILGFIFYIIGPQRLFAQYLNVLFGLWVVFLVYKILILLNINSRIIILILLIAAFFPNSMIMSAILLREIIPTFFVTWSLLFFILWYKHGRYINIIFSLVMLGIASIFHSGVIGMFFGYSFMYLFYKRNLNSFRFSSNTLVTFVIIAGLTYLATVQFSDALFYKFNKVEEIGDIYKTANSRHGKSAYLTGMTINNPVQFVIYGPVKAFYFLTSPLPMNWRGSIDIFTFVFDSMLYFWVVFYFLKNRKIFRAKKPLITGIILIIIGVALIFGAGVSNAGTAVRHRQKILPVFLVLAAVMMDEKRRYNNNYILRKSSI